MPACLKNIVILTAFLSCALAALGVSPAARAKTFRVNSGFDVTDLDPGNGLCVAYLLVNPPFVLPFCTLRAAIQESNGLPGSDVIELSSGTYRIGLAGREEDQALTGDYDITDSLRIVGAGANLTFIDAAGLDRVLDILKPGITVTLSGLSIINGNLPAGIGFDQKGGAGIRNQSAVIIQHSTLAANSVLGATDEDSGGAILNRGTCTVRFSSIRNNTAREGGGVLNDESGSLDIYASTINNNVAMSGAGIANFGSATLTNMTISNNKADSGALLSGGGIGNNGQLQVTQCTIAENSAPAGGGIGNRGTLTMINTLLAANLGGNCLADAEITSLGYNLDSNGTCQMNARDTDLQQIDPELAPLLDNGGPTETHAIYYGSPARDRGKKLVSITTDQRGNLRPAGSKYDIGSFEASLPAAPFNALLLLKN